MQIEFTERPLDLASLVPEDVLQIAPFPNHPIDLLCVTTKQLWRINITDNKSDLITSLPDLQLSDKTPIQIQISPCGNYAAITRSSDEVNDNFGVVVNLIKGEIVFELKDFDYHSELTVFPVAFFQHHSGCHMVYASDWNSLDIINLQNGLCLTSRKDEPISQQQREDAVFTEWAGELRVSPDNKHIATIGWAWHPVGLAWSFSLEKWLKNKWEADFGKSKIQLGGAWSYFWYSPFAWLDNEKIIIWGDAETQDENDIPANNVVIYNAITGEKLFSFDGPTMDVFEIDGDFLFSGIKDNDGISMWDWHTGRLLATHTSDFKPIAYQAKQKRFIARNKSRQFRCIEWKFI